MLIREFMQNKAHIRVYDNRKSLGDQAGADIAAHIRQLLSEKKRVRIMFAAAPSQNETLWALIEEKDIDWERVDAYHMDEYIGISSEHPASFVLFLKNAIFDRLPFGSVSYINGAAADTGSEAERYGALLAEADMDICIMGIGENGHIAFNDPSVADFNDPEIIKVVELEERCKLQQVNDAGFGSIEDVPPTAFTVTIPWLLKARKVFCVVPGIRKADAVSRALNSPLTLDCPATILKDTNGVEIYLDNESASKL